MKVLSPTNFHFDRLRYQKASSVAFVQVADHPFECSMMLPEPDEKSLPLPLDREGIEGDSAVHLPEDEAIGR